MLEIKHYITEDGRDLFSEWRDKVKDIKVRIAIDRRLYNLELGNFGDHKPCREGVWELRIDLGSGHRIYYAQVERIVILLLCGGIKRSQEADILKACELLKDWKRRT
ncbi:type II toxin-antitoxin system RelE/ParE family toxin [Xylella fastidiosa subsp. morus]|jgi:putative addiction module killer protein|uniref:Type II toxin-antitoxin system RelE/ParE family toxin n=2 Tax=Xylella fastidiosa TaxID=2371 RepID=A0ABC8ADF1_XYLFS|nr:type II toxin-antitoxin system RelE/ParE family toxin [Xylella fastidiosa]AAF85613.1 conserved hypothetical protein [Xylella fastidiosa 9a5c]AIC12343.1 addiction module antitoxin RelB [Xylella fastidiosa MUL0034]ALQ96022.1 addiction module protein [Xylella fastidiosa]ALR03259.1 addiction module protein [Xylella fastidiosa]ALR05479.1 type II toxin-antitoxin system RelE/ParE family toxin [Xylella fastidiosa]